MGEKVRDFSRPNPLGTSRSGPSVGHLAYAGRSELAELSLDRAGASSDDVQKYAGMVAATLPSSDRQPYLAAVAEAFSMGSIPQVELEA